MAKKKVVRVRLKSFDHKLIDDACKKILDVVTKTGANAAGPIPLPTDKQVYTILRAVHKYKDAREQFEIRTHKRLIDITDVQPGTITELRKLNLPSGVDILIKL